MMDEYKQYKPAYTGSGGGSSGAPEVPPRNPPNEYSESGVLTNSLLTNSYTAVLGFRVPIRYHYIYKKMDEEEKNIVREALRSFFIHIVNNIASIDRASISVSSSAAVYNFNVNINVVGARAEASSGSEQDEFTKERVKLMKERLRTAEEVLREYKRKTEEARRVLVALQQALQARDWATASKLLGRLREVVG